MAEKLTKIQEEMLARAEAADWVEEALNVEVDPADLRVDDRGGVDMASVVTAVNNATRKN